MAELDRNARQREEGVARWQAQLAELQEQMRADGTLERLKDVDWGEAIRAGRDDYDDWLSS